MKGHRTNERPRYASGELLIHHSGEAWKVTDRWLPGADAADPSDHAGIFPEDGDYRIESMVTGARIRVHADYLHGDGWRRCT